MGQSGGQRLSRGKTNYPETCPKFWRRFLCAILICFIFLQLLLCWPLALGVVRRCYAQMLCAYAHVFVQTMNTYLKRIFLNCGTCSICMRIDITHQGSVSFDPQTPHPEKTQTCISVCILLRSHGPWQRTGRAITHCCRRRHRLPPWRCSGEIAGRYLESLRLWPSLCAP